MHFLKIFCVKHFKMSHLKLGTSYFYQNAVLCENEYCTFFYQNAEIVKSICLENSHSHI